MRRHIDKIWIEVTKISRNYVNRWAFLSCPTILS
jgi:hypothetical protein